MCQASGDSVVHGNPPWLKTWFRYDTNGVVVSATTSASTHLFPLPGRVAAEPLRR
jgi:hypothetical protein